MAIKTFTAGSVLTAADTNTYLANAGLVYVKSQTIGSGVSSVTVTDAFSSTYDNYMIQVSGGSCSTGVELNLRLGSTTSGYHFQFIYTLWAASISCDSTKTADRFAYVGGAGPSGITASITVLSPYLATNTRVFSSNGGNLDSYVGNMNGALFNTSQYTSFILYPQAGTLTGGTITVYGYRKA